MATKNPYADSNGNPKPGKSFEWVSWLEENGDDSLDDLTPEARSQEEQRRERFQERMASESFPS